MSREGNATRFEMARRMSATIQEQRKNNLPSRFCLSGRVEVKGPNTPVNQDDLRIQLESGIPLSEALPGITPQLSLFGRVLGVEISKVRSVITSTSLATPTVEDETTFIDTTSPKVWRKAGRRERRGIKTIIESK